MSRRTSSLVDVMVAIGLGLFFLIFFFALVP